MLLRVLMLILLPLLLLLLGVSLFACADGLAWAEIQGHIETVERRREQ
jgi:hypothetical protein